MRIILLCFYLLGVCSLQAQVTDSVPPKVSHQWGVTASMQYSFLRDRDASSLAYDAMGGFLQGEYTGRYKKNSWYVRLNGSYGAHWASGYFNRTFQYSWQDDAGQLQTQTVSSRGTYFHISGTLGWMHRLRLSTSKGTSFHMGALAKWELYSPDNDIRAGLSHVWGLYPVVRLEHEMNKKHRIQFQCEVLLIGRFMTPPFYRDYTTPGNSHLETLLKENSRLAHPFNYLDITGAFEYSAPVSEQFAMGFSYRVGVRSDTENQRFSMLHQQLGLFLRWLK